jgi:hypothetical protein
VRSEGVGGGGLTSAGGRVCCGVSRIAASGEVWEDSPQSADGWDTDEGESGSDFGECGAEGAVRPTGERVPRGHGGLDFSKMRRGDCHERPYRRTVDAQPWTRRPVSISVCEARLPGARAALAIHQALCRVQEPRGLAAKAMDVTVDAPLDAPLETETSSDVDPHPATVTPPAPASKMSAIPPLATQVRGPMPSVSLWVSCLGGETLSCSWCRALAW